MKSALAAIAFVSAVVSVVFGIYILRRNPERPANRMFAVFGGLVFAASVGEFIVITAGSPAAALTGARIMAIQWCMTPAVLAHFAMSLMDPPLEKRRIFLAILYVAGVVLLVLVWSTDLVISGMAVPAGSYNIYHEVRGVLYVPVNAIVIVGDLAAIAVFFLAWRRARSRAARGSMATMVAAGLFILVATSITTVLLPAVGIDFPLGYSYVWFILVLMTGYAVTHYDFLSTVGSSLSNTLISSIREAVLIIDDRGTIEKANEAAEELTGYAEGALPGGTIDELFAGSPPDSFTEPHNEEEQWLLLRRASGELVPVSRSDGVVRSRRGNVLGSVVVLHDMREAFRVMRAEREAREAAEAAKAERERSEALEAAHREVLGRMEFLQGILDNLAQPVFIKNLDLEYVYANRAFQDILGLRRECVLGRTAEELFGEELPHLLTESELEVLRTGEPVEIAEIELGPAGAGSRTLSVLEAPLPVGEGVTEYIIGVMSDVTAQRSLEKARLDFIRVAAHELKTPLTSLWLGVDLLAREVRDRLTDDEERSLEVLRLSTERLVALARNLLDLASVDAGLFLLDRREVEVESLLEEVAAVMEVQLDRKGLDCKVECSDGQAYVWADRTRLSQVLSNLLDNAVKFTQAGSVGVSVRDCGGGTLEFCVSDTGCGIELSRIEAVFSRFSRVQNSGSPGEGTGLGLSIAKAIVEAHGGRIWAESTPGEGSRFYFTIARAEA